MELRHLRYFIAVAEAGSLTVAAQRKLHPPQPSLSGQIGDLEADVGAHLLTRGARGTEQPGAGGGVGVNQLLGLVKLGAASSAARGAAGQARQCFAMGFRTGPDLAWRPEPEGILRAE